MGLLGWALMFLVIAVIAALFGFTGIAAGAATIAKVLFGIFLVIFLLLLIMAMLGGAVAAGAPLESLGRSPTDCVELAIASSFGAIPIRGALQPA